MYVLTSVLVSPQEMELWRLKHPNESFSEWVRRQVSIDVNQLKTPELSYTEAWEAQAEQEKPDSITCPKGPLAGLIVTALECDGCTLKPCSKSLSKLD